MQWVCEICGYGHDEDEVPEMCPICGAPSSKFTESSQDERNLLTHETVNDDLDTFDNDLYGDYAR